MRAAVVSYCLLACLFAGGPASAAGCPGNPNAIGTSRTIVIDPAEHGRLGGYQYPESLPLNDREVVLTFDDGPLPPHTTKVLDVLARECVKATFFMVGRMAREFPRIVRRVHADGHNVASHSQTHPYSFYRMAMLDAAWEIEESFGSLADALGDTSKVAPFFRFPGLHRQEKIEHYLASKKRMTWSVDFMGDDWTPIGPNEIVKRVLSRLEAQRKGILMLHDIKPTTAAALPKLLDELRARGFRIVHAVPASGDRPKTATTPAQWRVAHPPTAQELSWREPSIWPRAFARKVDRVAPNLEAPSPQNFGAATADSNVPIMLVPAEEALRNEDRRIALPQWPDEVITSTIPENVQLPVPSVETFRFVNGTRARTKRSRQKAQIAGRPLRTIAPSTVGSEFARIPTSAGTGRDERSGRGKTQNTGRPQLGHQIPLLTATPRIVRGQ